MKKTSISSEVAFSNSDQNLFSTLDNEQNKGIATKLNWEQILIDKKWKLLSDINYLFIHKNFNTIQRFQSVEFNRDWNLNNPTGNQQQIGIDLSLKKNNDNFLSYAFQQLQFSNNFKGNKHIVTSEMNFGNTSFYNSSSYLTNNSGHSRKLIP